MNVKLHFILVGKTGHRSRKDDSAIDWTNENILEYVKDIVNSQFGTRALSIANERLLKNGSVTYPPFYSAGWFISENCDSELVVLAHGETMEEAKKSMMEHIKTIRWNEASVRI